MGDRGSLVSGLVDSRESKWSRHSVSDPSAKAKNGKIHKTYKSLLDVTKSYRIHWVVDPFGQLYWLKDGDGVNTGSD